jgi:hypothetical protein
LIAPAAIQSGIWLAMFCWPCLAHSESVTYPLLAIFLLSWPSIFVGTWYAFSVSQGDSFFLLCVLLCLVTLLLNLVGMVWLYAGTVWF